MTDEGTMGIGCDSNSRERGLNPHSDQVTLVSHEKSCQQLNSEAL